MNVEIVGDEMGPSLGMEQGGRDEDVHRGGGVEADQLVDAKNPQIEGNGEQ